MLVVLVLVVVLLVVDVLVVVAAVVVVVVVVVVAAVVVVVVGGDSLPDSLPADERSAHPAAIKSPQVIRATDRVLIPGTIGNAPGWSPAPSTSVGGDELGPERRP